MRSFVLMVVTVAVLFGGFVLYTRLAAPPARTNPDDLTPPPGISESTSSTTSNEPTASGAWVNLYDKDSMFYGRLRSATCTPRTDLLPDHIYHLTNPEAEFFQRDGQIAHLTAVKGDVRLGQQGQHTSFSGGPFQPPSSGVLEDVTVKLYPTAAARDADQPDITFKTPIAQFDADTYRLVNADMVDAKTGHVLPAEDVPVTMRGRDLDFDGTGLTLYWNDEAHELKSLLVAHGQKLRLYNTSEINSKTSAAPAPQSAPSTSPPNNNNPARTATVAAETSSQSPAPTAQAASDNPTPSTPSSIVSAPATPTASATLATTPPTTPATTQPTSPHIYLATFLGNVRVVQAGKTLVDADTMDVTMARRDDSDKSSGTSPTAPTVPHAPTKADALPAQAAVPKDVPTPNFPPITPPPSAPPTPVVAKPSSPASPTTPLATSAEPIDVYWTGPMKIVPVPKPPTAAGDILKPGEALIRFTGSPVQLHQPQMEAIGTRASYRTATGAGRLVGDTGKPLEVKLLKPDGAVSGTAHGDRLDFYQAPQNDRVVFTGAGHAEFSDPQKPADQLHAAWSKECDIQLPKAPDPSAKGKDAIFIQEADLKGDAVVTDGTPGGLEKLHLTANNITAEFDQPAPGAAKPNKPDQSGQPAATLKKVVATGNAVCVVRDGKSPDQNITTDQLTIETDKDTNGKPYPRFITADGNVHAIQAQQGELWSNRMDATVAPSVSKAVAATTQPDQAKFQLQTMLATGDVRAKSKSGDATGDILKVDAQNATGGASAANTTVTLLGTPLAVVTSNTDHAVLRGPKITWQQDAKGNVINVDGGVHADSTDADGTHNSAKSDHAKVELIPKTAVGAGMPAPKTAVISKSDSQTDPLSNKQIKQVTLLSNAQVISDLRGADNSIIRRRTLTGQEIDAYPPEQQLVVPGPGWMLLEDYTKPTTQPTTRSISLAGTRGAGAARGAVAAGGAAAGGAATQPAPNNALGGRGVTSFVWANQFMFDQIAGRAVFDGKASIIHQPDDPNSGPTRVTADLVTALFEPKSPADSTSDALARGKPKDKATSDQNQSQLKQVHAEGHVQITVYKDRKDPKADKIIEARRVDYDPATEMLIATGTADDPVRISDAQGHLTARFQQAWIDTRTNQVKKMIDFQGESR